MEEAVEIKVNEGVITRDQNATQAKNYNLNLTRNLLSKIRFTLSLLIILLVGCVVMDVAIPLIIIYVLGGMLAASISIELFNGKLLSFDKFFYGAWIICFVINFIIIM